MTGTYFKESHHNLIRRSINPSSRTNTARIIRHTASTPGCALWYPKEGTIRINE
jgi:hypothetical protein